MPYNFNGQILEQLPDQLDQAQRLLYYSDGLFESIRMLKGEIPLLKYHYTRLQAGLEALGIALPANWTLDFFEKEIRRVASGNARTRLMVWRSPGGWYRPENDSAQFMITAQPMVSGAFECSEPGISLGLAHGPRLAIDTFSKFKTLNAPRYVAAAREAAAQGWDDALLLNSLERICEASSSNVFWWQGNYCYTVPLSEGCVAGVMRAFLLQTALASGYAIQEKAITFTQLEEADEIFLTNAIRGIVPVRFFAEKLYHSERTRELFSRSLEYLQKTDKL